MDVLMVLIAIIGIAVSVANKKKTAEAQKQRQAARQREAAGSKPAASQGTQSRTSSAKSPAAPSKFPSDGPSKFPPATPRRQPAAEKKAQSKPTPAYGGTPQYTHVVTSTLEGGHTHTESSMTGDVACPPPKAATVQQKAAEAPAAATGGLLNFQANSILQGVLYAEILGKPKALQRD